MRRPALPVLSAAALALALACGSRQAAKVNIKFAIYDNDNSFAATIYAQEVSTGATTTFSYGPHTPSMTVEVKQPGTYLFYARLVEAPDDYHYGFTGFQGAAYGHMTRGGTRDPAKTNLIALDLMPGKEYKVYISDNWAELPARGKPVTVPWHRE